MAEPVKPVVSPATPPPDAKVIATPSYSKRIARDLAAVEKAKAEAAAIQSKYGPKVDAYEAALALVKAGKHKEFLDQTGLTRDQIAKVYGFTDAKAVERAANGSPPPKPAPGAPKEDPAIAELKAEIAAIKKAELDRIAAQQAATLKEKETAYLDRIVAHAVADKDAFAYTAQAVELDADDARSLMFEVADAWCKAHPEEKGVPSEESVALAVEQYYERQAERYAKVQKKPKVAGEPAGEAPKEEANGLGDKLSGAAPKEESKGKAWQPARPTPQQVLAEMRAAERK